VLRAIAYGNGVLVDEGEVTLPRVQQLRGTAPVVWLDVTGSGDHALLRAIGDAFGLHRLALEDVVNRHQRAKVEDYGEHEFLVLRMIDPTSPDDTEQLGMFVGPGFVLTFQERPEDCFGLIRQRLADPAGQMPRRGSDYLAYALLDAVVDAYFPVLEAIDLRLERVEAAVLQRDHGDSVVHELHGVRRHLVLLRRALWPLREALASLVRGEVRHFSPEVRPYLRDVQDNVVQLLDLVDSYRETSSSLMDLHLSSVNHRLNEVIKLLTIISTIFIPLTFLVGVYGMNFDWMPELRVWWAYPTCLSVMVVLAGGMLWWFRRRGWL
jgi:magnesium transporter